MYSCSQCNDLFLDYLYDLLEEGAVLPFRAHLEQCPACQAELDRARDQQRLFARAAVVYQSVPAFAPPTAEPGSIIPAELALSSQDTVVQNRDTVVDPVPQPARRLSVRWSWALRATAATAATLLIGAGILFGLYQTGLAERQLAYASARKAADKVPVEYQAVEEDFKQTLALLPNDLQGRQLKVEVYGPAVYQPGAENPLHLNVQDLTGKDVAADVLVECFADDGNRPLFQKTTSAAKGQAVVPLPADLPVPPGKALRLRFEACTSWGKAQLAQTVVAGGPSYLTYITTSKPYYRIGERLFFRTVTLDRFTLRPPDRTFALSYALVNSSGQKVFAVEGPTQPGGLGGGEFTLGTDLADGDYMLQVEEKLHEAGATYEFVPQTQRVLIHHPDSPELVLDHSWYRQNEILRAQYRGRRQGNGNAPANQALTVNLTRAATKGDKTQKDLLARPLQISTDKDGNAFFALPLAKNKVPAGKVNVEVQRHDGRKDEKVTQSVEVLPEWKVDFFPEGGNLVAGVKNRVYCRVTAPPAEASDLCAELLDAEGKIQSRVSLVKDSPRADIGCFGGSFQVQPLARAAGKLRVVAGGETRVEQSLPAAAIQGVALTALNPVAPEATPVECLLYATRPDQPLLAVTTCRGHLVDQQLVKAQPEGTKVQLRSATGVRGVLRLTIYEPINGQLVPKAERLVYRNPREWVNLSFQETGKQKDAPRLSDRLTLGLRSETEKGQPVKTWTAAAVVDEQAFQVEPDPSAGGPPGFFYLGGQAQHPADLENLPILLEDSPEAREALGRFLAIQGWRQFVAAPLAGMLAAHGPAEALGRLADVPALFSQDNLSEARQKYAQALHKEVDALEARLGARRLDFQDQQTRRLQQAHQALTELRDYEALPQVYLGWGLGLLALGLLLAGCVSLVVGLLRLAIPGKSATPLLALAFGAMLLVLMLCGGASHWLVPQDTPNRPAALEKIARLELPPLLELHREEEAANPVNQDNPLGQGVFAVVTHSRKEDANKTKDKTTHLVEATSDLKGRKSAEEKTVVVAGRLGRDTQTAQPLVKKLESEEQSEKRLLFEFDKTHLQQMPGGQYAPQSFNGPQTFPPTLPTRTGSAGGFSGGGTGVTQSPAVPAANPLDIAKAPTTPVSPVPPPGIGNESLPGAKDNNFPGQYGAQAPGPQDTKQGGSNYFRQYVDTNTANFAPASDTLLWVPNLVLEGGTGQVQFDLPYQNGTYRVLLYGHTASGRLGFLRGKIEVRRTVNATGSPRR